jgi:hypothetical protein
VGKGLGWQGGGGGVGGGAMHSPTLARKDMRWGRRWAVGQPYASAEGHEAEWAEGHEAEWV